MALAKNNKIDDTEFNDLFTRLNNVRAAHAAANGLSSAQRTNLQGSFPTNIAPEGSKASSNAISTLKSNIKYLEDNSPYIPEDTRNDASTSDFSSRITIPSAGNLIELSNYVTMVQGLEAECPNCASFNSSFNSGFNSSFNSGFNSSFNSSHCGAHFPTHNYHETCSFNSSFNSGFSTCSFNSGFNSSFNSGVKFSFGHCAFACFSGQRGSSCNAF